MIYAIGLSTEGYCSVGTQEGCLTIMAIELEQILKYMDKMPEPPKASVQAVSMLEDASVPISKVAEFISMDECLTSKLLKLSNSASYGYSGRVITAKEAMMRVGTNIVKATLYSSMLEMAGFTPSPFFVELWKSALYCAFMSRDIGEMLNHPQKDLCFTAGLLADIGQLTINEFAPNVYPKLIDKIKEDNYELVSAEQQVLGLTHARVGVRMAEIWKLPPVYQGVIKYHHNPIAAYSMVLPDDYKVIMAVHIASELLPLIGNQSGEASDLEAFRKGNFNVPLEIVIQRIQQKFDSYSDNVLKVADTMFGSIPSAA